MDFYGSEPPMGCTGSTDSATGESKPARWPRSTISLAVRTAHCGPADRVDWTPKPGFFTFGDAIRHRQDVFRRETTPLIEIYGERGMLVTVDGIGDVNTVAERILTGLSERGIEIPDDEPDVAVR